MAKRFFTIIFSLILVLFLVSTSTGFDNKLNRKGITNDASDLLDYTRENASKPLGQGGYYGGHDTITAEGMLLKEQVHQQTDPDGGADFRNKMVREVLPSLRIGAHDEDCTKIKKWALVYPFPFPIPIEIPLSDSPFGPNGDGNFFDHFYNPDTDKGLKHGWLGNSALERAQDYINEIHTLTRCRPDVINNLPNEDKEKVYDYLGRIMHLFEDMAVPSHTKDDIHVFTKPFEDYVSDHWTDIVNTQKFQEAVTVEEYLNGNYDMGATLNPVNFMKELAKFSHQYPNEEELYDIESGVNENGEIVINKVLNEERLKNNVNKLIPEVIKYAAGYINAIYDALTGGVTGSDGDICKPTLPPPGPGNDHPDDRFDVSDEFYWEKEFGLSNADLTDLYIRTAIKKGKIGVWYKKRFMEIFIEGRTKYKDASQEVKDSIEAEFQAIGKKLEERKDEAESDWKGSPDVALFAYGFYNPAISLMLKFKEPVAFMGLDFDPSIVKDHPVMIVPSGGFYGLENSEILRAKLDEYVKNGGTLIVFAQQHGYEYSILPVPQEADSTYNTIIGYGWTEDQSCQSNSTYLDTYHQILSGQSRSTPSLNVDGYFTTYPSNSTVLLRRTVNGQPAMVMYDYGQGKVILASMYSDWAYSHSQASKEEIALFRDMISWAKEAEQLPEIKQGETVSVSLSVKNNMDIDASSIKYFVYNPDRTTLLLEETLTTSILLGQSLIIPVSYTASSSSELGIYHIDYELYDIQGNVIQPKTETDSGRFIVSNPPATAYQPTKTFQVWVTSPGEYVIKSSEVTFTIHIKNNTPEDLMNAKIGIGSHEEMSSGGQWWIFRDIIEGINIPAGEQVDIPWTFRIDISQSIYFGLFKSSDNPNNYFVGRGLARAEKGIRIAEPSANITAQTDKALYAKGETIIINTVVQNSIMFDWQADIKITIKNPRNTNIFEDIKTANLPPKGTGNVAASFTLPSSLAFGTYIVRVEASFKNEHISSASTSFELLQSHISVTSNLPSAFTNGSNILSFALNNTGKINISSGNLDVSMKDPEGVLVHSGSHSFSIAVGENKTLDIPISILPLKFGNYTLTYTQSDETRTGSPTTIIIPNIVKIALNFDKPSYRVREKANLVVNLMNSGKFNLENMSVTISAPDMNYTNTQIVSLQTANGLLLTYDIQIPETSIPGQYNANVTLTLPSGSSVLQGSKFSIPEALVRIDYTGEKSLTAGDVIELDVENTGGVDAQYIIEIKLTSISDALSIYQDHVNDIIQADTSKKYSFQIPLQARSDGYVLDAKVSGDFISTATFSELIDISGVEASLSVRTNKDIYLSTEDISALFQIVNQTYEINEATLNLQITDKCSSVWVESFHISTWDGTAWVERGVLHYPNTLETQSFDLSGFLPDPSGDYKIRIENTWTVSAYIDYITLLADSTSYAPSYAKALNRNSDILGYVSEPDDWSANVRSNIVEIRWAGIPPAANKTLLMRAQEERINLCGESIYWQTDILINEAANTTIDSSHTISPLFKTGQLYLQGILRSQTGQIIANAEYPFSVIDGDIALRIQTDKNLYRPGEMVMVTGVVNNMANGDASEIRIEISDNDGEVIYSETFNISANGSHTFSFTTTAGVEGIYRLSGKVIQNSSTLFEMSDRYEIAIPNVSVSVAAPEIAGNEPFNINVEIKNEGKIEAVVSLDSSVDNQTQTVTISAGETKLIQYSQQITNDTAYTFTFTGDLNQTITKTVSYGNGISIAINPLTAYPEGSVSIPLTITNIGQLDENLILTFTLQPSALVQQKTYFVAKNGNLTDILHLDLTEGNYQLSADSQLPITNTQVNFSVRKENKVGMAIFSETQTNELIPVTVNLSNIGYNSLSGSVQLSAVSNQEVAVWSEDQSVSQLLPQNSQLLTFNINPSAIEPGNHTLKAEFFNDSGQQLGVVSSPVIIYGPIFQITQLPPYQTFTAGGEATFTFKVKNTGNKEGAFDFHFKAYDLIDSTKKEWLMPDEGKPITFSSMLPIDLEENDYYADYELKGQGSGTKGQVKYHVEGISLSVDANLDRQYYNEGETTNLTLNIQSQGTDSPSLFARINYNGYEEVQPFTLNETETLTFDIPLTEITGEKLFYGIYHESGRSINLNSLYIYKAGDVLTITIDKQVYNPGETVLVTVDSVSGAGGTLTLSAPDYSEAFAFTGTASKSFTLPATMVAGTYSISFEFSATNGETYTGNHPFDVAGISVKVKEATLDKGKYATSDTLNLGITIESNQNLSATLKTWIVDPEGKYTDAGENIINLTSLENLLITHNASLVTAVSGIHRLVYGVYTGDLLLVSGSEAFDVGDAILTGITTNKTDYPTNIEFMNVTVSMFGTVDANLELQLDGNTIRTQSVALNGFSTLNIELGTVEPGTHILEAMLTTGGLKSTKETTFSYALSLLDSDNDGMPDEWETAHGLDSNDPEDANSDPDNDGLLNLQEYQHSTNPNNPDTDNDDMPDGWEVMYDLNPNVNDASSDKDNDGFSNLQEYQSGSNPTDPTIIPNQSPVANAGANQNVITGTLVTLNGSESFDPESAMITFLWAFIEVPASSNITDISLSDATSPKPTFTPDVNGTYRLELVINDGVLESTPDEVVIIADTPNVAPNANAGPDQNVSTSATVYLDGLESNDPDNGPQLLSYLWSFYSIPPVSGSLLTDEDIVDRKEVNASFIPDVDGTYTIKLMVSDGDLSSNDDVVITATTPNVPPNANAGPDITIPLDQTAVLDGSASNDPDDGPSSLDYSWIFVTVPAGSQIENEDIIGADSVSPSFIPDMAGTYVLQLMVSDGIDAAFDNVAVTVINKATLCSILGNDPKPSILDQDIFKFRGAKGETVTVRLEADLSEAGLEKRVTLMLTDNIKGTLLLKLDRSELPNEIKATLPATGEYLITVAEQPKIAKGERYRGAYCLSLEASQETMQTLKPALWVEE